MTEPTNYEVRWSPKQRHMDNDWVSVHAADMRMAAHDFTSSQFDAWGWENAGEFCSDMRVDVRLSEHAPIHEYIVMGEAVMVFTPAYRGALNKENTDATD